MKKSRQSGFSKFYEKWMSRLDEMLHQLLKALKKPVSQCDECELKALVCRAKEVYCEYDVQKWSRVEEGMSDILDFYSPVWLSPFEKSRHWVTGWKPLAAFVLMDSLMGNKCKKISTTKLNEGQMMKMRELSKMVQVVEEEMVEREIDSTQTAVTDRTILELAELGGEEMAGERLLNELEKVMRAADCLRFKTVEGIMEILNVEQNVEFFAAAYMLQINMRKLGQRKEMNSNGVMS